MGTSSHFWNHRWKRWPRWPASSADDGHDGDAGSRTPRKRSSTSAAARIARSEKRSAALLVASFLVSCLVFFKMEGEHARLKAFHDSVHNLITKKAGGGGKCDYSKGLWVRSQRKLLYSGQECQRWLSPMWACRLQPNRSSFLYESLHWQPHACSLPPFHPPTFLHRMQNRTIAFIGDSLGRQQFQSLMCLLTHGKDDYENVVDVGSQFGFPPYVKSNKLNNTKAIRPSSWAYRFEHTQTTILFAWSPTLCHIENLATNLSEISNVSEIGDPSQRLEVPFHVDRPPNFLSSNLDKLDVVILNTGPHWSLNKFTKNRWKPHLEKKPLNVSMTKESINRLYYFTLSKLMDWLDIQAKIGATTARIFYRTVSPHHFVGGEWNSGGRCDNIHYRFMNSISMRNLSKPPYLDDVGDMLVQHNMTINLLNITWLSQLRDEAHISKYTLKSKNATQDCLHWCLPGVPDTWNEILYAYLLQATPK